ncbi:peptidylprolyl isomerase [Lutimonas saemankumensis]|uniref:peptidylprolyl isomerase n=1 Tax=Lutimonas saemankumensis TaxID=483016 RepID=UPI001CD4CDF4|nr:peptidylprolyl isomerase [Lutimonas saemankumensis]MCA0932078.1 peptidylprolyl isomerase [Lutimonas saemankumensis]
MKIMNSFLLIILMSIISCKSTKHADLDDGLYADLQTDRGDILLKLEYDKVPITVANFVSLAEGTNPYVEDQYKGKPFYDGLIFHRVVEDFMVQGGDPRGNGSGNPGYKFEDEFPMDDTGNLVLSHDSGGILSMANSGPDSNGSQFFITHKETPWLDGKHSVFGFVVQGQEVVDSIAKGDIIQKLEIIRVGKKAKEFDAATEFTSYFEKIEERERLAEERKKEAKENLVQFVQDNEASAVVLSSGLKVIKIKEGNGEKPAIGSKVNVLYAGYFVSGDLFDTNVKETAETFGKYDRRKDQMNMYKSVPMDYSPDAALIPGFKEGLQQMNYGDKVLLLVPSHLAYGDQGAGNVIPPNTDLLFELEILEK